MTRWNVFPHVPSTRTFTAISVFTFVQTPFSWTKPTADVFLPSHVLTPLMLTFSQELVSQSAVETSLIVRPRDVSMCVHPALTPI